MIHYFDKEQVIARKQHQCEWCLEPIKKGAKYFKQSAVDNGDWWTKESEEIFEPKKGDLVVDNKNRTTTLKYDSYAIDIEQVEFWGTTSLTIMRDNKHFFNAKIDNNDK